jgi:hypothetical protein
MTIFSPDLVCLFTTVFAVNSASSSDLAGLCLRRVVVEGVVVVVGRKGIASVE